MLKRTIATLLLPLVLLQLTGCTKQSWIGNAEPRPERLEKVRAIRTADGDEVRLDSKPAPVIQNDSLHAIIDGERDSIATENIVDYKVVRTDVGNTIALVLLPLVVAGVVATIAMAESFSEWGNASVGDHPRASRAPSPPW